MLLSMQAELLGVNEARASWRSRLAHLKPSLLLAGSRCGAVGLQFLVQIVVGGMAGAAGLGVLQLFASWSCMVGEGLARGLPTWAMRAVAVEAEGRPSARARNNLRWAALCILRLSLAAGAVACLAMLVFDSQLPGDYRQLAIAVIVGAPLFALLRLGAEALKGAGWALRAVSIENLVLPVFLLLVCIACWLGGAELHVTTLLCAGVIGLGLALWLVWRALRARLPVPAGIAAEQVAPSHDVSDLKALWANSVLAVAFMQLPFLILPWYASPAEIGTYAVAHKLVNIVTTLLILLTAVFGPAFARAAATGRSQPLHHLLRRTQWLSCLVFLPLCTVLLLAVGPLALVFNVPAQELFMFLAILAVGQLVNAATGLSGVLLNMAGGAALEATTLIGAIGIALLASPFVADSHGVFGLAVLFSAVLAAKNLVSYLAALVFLSWRDAAS